MKKYWFKEPWAWFVFTLPAIAVVAGITTYFIANADPDPLVVDDYYKEGKAINLQLSKMKLAQKLGIRFDFKLTSSELIIKPTGIEKVFPKLDVNFYHPTLDSKDFHLSLTPDGNGYFRHSFDQAPQGKWKVTVTPFEDHWKIQKTIYLPQENFIDFSYSPNAK